MEIPQITLPGGARIPALGLGTWMLEGETCRMAVETALRLGYMHIDTADAYANHAEVGAALKKADRSKLFLATKVWHAKLGYGDVHESCERALRELGTPYIDLYLIHWPNSEIPMEETFRALKELQDEGKIRHVGVSNFTIAHLKEALRVTKRLGAPPVAVDQVEFHPFLNQQELLEFCTKHGIVLTAYSPLARGRVYKNEKLAAIAKRHQKSPGQVALRWAFQKGAVVIPKASSERHLRENMEIFDFELSPEEMREIDSLPQQRIVAPAWSEFE